jgi:hypothetical protein
VNLAELVGRDEDEESRKRNPQIGQAGRGVEPTDQERQDGDREQQRGRVDRRDVSLAVEVEDRERRPIGDGEHAEHTQERDDDAVRDGNLRIGRRTATVSTLSSSAVRPNLVRAVTRWPATLL